MIRLLAGWKYWPRLRFAKGARGIHTQPFVEAPCVEAMLKGKENMNTKVSLQLETKVEKI